MRVLNEATATGKSSNTYVLIMDKREARTLLEIAEAAFKANKRRSSFRRWWKKLEDCLECF